MTTDRFVPFALHQGEPPNNDSQWVTDPRQMQICTDEQISEVRQRLERTLTILRRTLGANHPHLAHTRMTLAELALAHDDGATAREHAEHSVTLLASSVAEPDNLARARFILAQALWPDPCQRFRAYQLAKQARTAYAALEQGEAFEQISHWLATHRIGRTGCRSDKDKTTSGGLI